MPVVVVANPKGGVGKSTLSTNVAGYFASQGHSVMLGDADRQQSSALWLKLRPEAARPIATWNISHDLIARPPRDTSHVVLDTPAGLHGWRFKDVLKLADKVLVPLQPSIFDIYATRAFLDELAGHLAIPGKTIHNPAGWLHSLVRRHAEGFVALAMAAQIADMRARQRRHQERLAGSVARSSSPDAAGNSRVQEGATAATDSEVKRVHRQRLLELKVAFTSQRGGR